MNETITRSAGAAHGQEMSPARMEALIRAAGRRPVQRTTLYQAVSEERRRASLTAAPLADVVNTPARKYQREADAAAASASAAE
jgi:FO synthase